MIKRTTEQWQSLFIAHEQSGMTATAFCREHKLCKKYFSLRKKQLDWSPASGPQPKMPNPFITAVVTPPPASIELHSGAARLTLPAHVEPLWLATLLKALA